MLAAGFGVLLADGIDSAGVQAKLLAAASSKVVQVEAGKPLAAKAQRILLSVIAEVPDKVDCTSLLVEQTIQGLDTVAICEYYRPILTQSVQYVKRIQNRSPRCV